MIYYVETNLIAILVGTILLIQGKRLASRNETSQILLNGMLRLLVLVSVFDIAAYYSRGRSAIGVEISNIVYFIIIALASYFWFLYIIVAVERTNDLKKTIMVTGIPIIILIAAILTNPWTHYFFTIDEYIFYHRGSGVALSWLVEWAYLLAALGINIMALHREKRSFKRSEYLGYVVFVIPIAVASICQMLFYGTTTAQVGFMIAMLLAFLNKQHFRVQKDDLTGLNNRNALMSYRDSMVNRSKPLEITFFMMDLDKFKQINDVYGHIKGDQALKDAAEILKKAAAELNMNGLRLYRYGGDEFVIIGGAMSEREIETLKAKLEEKREEMNQRNMAAGEKYQLHFSIGAVSMSCADECDFDEIVRRSDEKMYQAKKSCR